MTTHLIHDAVRTGRITPSQGALLLELRAELARARDRKRRLDILTFGPLRRWIARRWGR